MKKVTFLVAVIFSVFFLTSCDKETVLADNNIPSEIKSYVSTHFPTNTIVQAIKDKDGLSKSYDVILDGGFKLEFNKSYNITDVESTNKTTKLPDSVIPAKLLAYVAANYPNNTIVSWELDDKNQQIELNNGLDLEFNMNGDFLRIDS